MGLDGSWGAVNKLRVRPASFVMSSIGKLELLTGPAVVFDLNAIFYRLAVMRFIFLYRKGFTAVKINFFALFGKDF